jgi:hypothetical protein
LLEALEDGGSVHRAGRGAMLLHALSPGTPPAVAALGALVSLVSRLIVAAAVVTHLY